MRNIARISAFILASTLAIIPVVQGESAIVESKSFSITLTGKESFQKLIKTGKYYSVDEELTEVNPKPAHLEKGEKILTLVEFPETIPIPMEYVVAQLKASGLRPATVFELLAFGAKYPNEQLLAGRPILSPAATLEFVDMYDEEKMIQKYHIYLRGVSDKRMLSTNYAGMFWSKHWRCLVAQMTEAETKTTAPLSDGKSAGQKGGRE